MIKRSFKTKEVRGPKILEILAPLIVSLPLLVSYLLKKQSWLWILGVFLILLSLLLIETKFKIALSGLLAFVIIEFLIWRGKFYSLEESDSFALEGSFKVFRVFEKSVLISKDSRSFQIPIFSLPKVREGDYLVGRVEFVLKSLGSLSDFEFANNLFFKTKKFEFWGVERPLFSTVEIKEKIREWISSWVVADQRPFFELLVFGKKSQMTKELWGKIRDLGVLHFFVISGFHISFIDKVIRGPKKLKFFKRAPRVFDFFSSLFLIFYVWILNWSYPALRALSLVLFKILASFSKRVSKISDFWIFSGLIVVVFLFNPESIFSLSFLLSFFIYYKILLINAIKVGSKKVNFALRFLILALLGLTINLALNHKIILFFVFFQIFFGALVSLIFPLALFGFWTGRVLEILFLGLSTIIEWFFKINFYFEVSNWTKVASLLCIIFLLCSTLSLVWKTIKSKPS